MFQVSDRAVGLFVSTFLERTRRRNCRRPRHRPSLSLVLPLFEQKEGRKEWMEKSVRLKLSDGRGRINGGGGDTNEGEKEAEKRGESRGERRARGQPLTITNRRA